MKEIRPDLTVTTCTSILREEVLGVAGTIINMHGGLPARQ